MPDQTTTEQEALIALAKKCGADVYAGELIFTLQNLEAFAAALTQADEAAKLREALIAVNKLLVKNVTFVGGGPDSHVRVPFDSHDQAWNHWHEAREIARAAIGGKP